MATLTIELPDNVARSLADLAAAENKTVQEVALERLMSIVAVRTHPTGSPAAVLQAMNEPPHIDAADVDALDAAVAAGRLPVRTEELFHN